MMPKFSREDFLEALFSEYFRKRKGFIQVRTVRKADQKTSTRFFPSIDSLDKEQYQTDLDVFMGVCPRESMKPEKRSIRFITALWAGLDLTPDGFSGKGAYFSDQKQAAKAVRSFPLSPSIIVESGRGLHLYWLLKEVTELRDPARLEKLLKLLNGYFLCANDVGIDASLRLPGTVNAKITTATVHCGIKYLGYGFRYGLEDFENLDLAGGAPSTKSDAPLQPDKTSAPANIRPASNAAPPTPLAQARPTPAVPSSGPPDIRSDPDEGLSATTPEYLSESGSTVVVVAEETPDNLADEIVDRVVDKLADKLMDRLVDEIVERLYKRLTAKGGT